MMYYPILDTPETFSSSDRFPTFSLTCSDGFVVSIFLVGEISRFLKL